MFGYVNVFKYLGSQLACNGSIVDAIKKRIVKPSHTFGSLKKPLFQDRLLRTKTKRVVYKTAVLGTLWLRVLDHLARPLLM